MSFRTSRCARQGKRMLVYFEADNGTAIMKTSEAKSVVSGGKLEEGAMVLVEFDKIDFKGLVVKLHGK